MNHAKLKSIKKTKWQQANYTKAAAYGKIVESIKYPKVILRRDYTTDGEMYYRSIMTIEPFLEGHGKTEYEAHLDLKNKQEKHLDSRN